MKALLKDKNISTNVVAVAVILFGYLFSSYFFKLIGFFALSGAITNWLATDNLTAE